MALIHRHDIQDVTRRLEAWLAHRRPELDGARVEAVELPHASGMSSQTVLFDVCWTGDAGPVRASYVARVTPEESQLFPTYDLAQEQRVMAAAAAVLPVPHVEAVEPGDGVLGAPFMLMERRYGRVPADDPPFTTAGWVHELTDGERATLFDNALRVVARVPAADVSALPATTLGRARGSSSVEQHLAHYERLYEWAAQGRSHPVIEQAFSWVAANLPDVPGPDVLSWGDARLGNMMFGDDLGVTAVLDWEMAGVGPAELDLGWFVFLNRFFTDGLGVPLPGGFPDRDATVARYEELSGRAVRDFDFFEVFAALRGAVLNMRVAYMLIEAGALPLDAEMPNVNPATVVLARLIGAEGAHDGGPADYISGAR
jgi:aminoglycoside phosphotransferase (APT) family kinase protein